MGYLKWHILKRRYVSISKSNQRQILSYCVVTTKVNFTTVYDAKASSTSTTKKLI